MGELRVLHYPQIPCNPFIVYVENLEEAKKFSDTLAEYDSFQYENKIKPDYSNLTLVEEFDGEEWVSWMDEETGIEYIDEYFEYLERAEFKE